MLLITFADSEGCTNLKMKRTKCIVVVRNVLGPHFSRDLKNNIGDQKSNLQIDESNDMTTTKLHGIAI